MKNILFLLLAIFHLNSNPTIKAADLEAKNEHNETLYLVDRLEGNRSVVAVPNRHRDKPNEPLLKFSLHGASVDGIEKNGSSSNWILTLSDGTKAEILIKEHNNNNKNTTEYYFLWHGGGPNEEREVCFHYKHAFWYNGYNCNNNADWPMNSSKVVSKQTFNYLFNYNRYSGSWPYPDAEGLLVLEQIFFNSDGFSIALDYQSPLYIERVAKNTQEPLLCFSVNKNIPSDQVYTPYMTSNQDPSYLDIKFTIFASRNIRDVTDFVVHQSGLIPRPSTIPNTRMFTNPSWMLWDSVSPFQDKVLPFINESVAHGFSASHTNLILPSYPSYYLPVVLKKDLFPEKSFAAELRQHGYNVGMQVRGFDMYFDDQYCIGPTYRDRVVECVVDFTNPEAIKKYLDILVSMKHERQLDSFVFVANEKISDFGYKDPLVRKYPSLFTTKYAEALSQLADVNTSIILECAFKSQHLPVWTRLAHEVYAGVYDQTLLHMIPNVLAVSIAGYSFIVPYSVATQDDWFELSRKPNEEIFIRMMQAVTFMPSIAFGRMPWDISLRAVEVTKKCLQLHREHVPVLLELAKKRISDGSPIVRPMWYVAPDDPRTYPIGDQYMLGEDIIVAPVVIANQRKRTVYFPIGTWLDQHGKSYQGPNEFTVDAPLEELPYFKRKQLPI